MDRHWLHWRYQLPAVVVLVASAAILGIGYEHWGWSYDLVRVLMIPAIAVGGLLGTRGLLFDNARFGPRRHSRATTRSRPR